MARAPAETGVAKTVLAPTSNFDGTLSHHDALRPPGSPSTGWIKASGAVAERAADCKWKVNQLAKKADAVSFRLNDIGPIPADRKSVVWGQAARSSRIGADRFRDAGFARCPARSGAVRPLCLRT